MQRLFILSITFVVVLSMAIGLTLFFSLIPHFKEIGWAVLGLLIVGIGCSAVLAIAFTTTKVQNMLSARNHSRLMSRVILFTDGAAFVDGTGQWQHLSAEHQRAQVALPQTIVQSLPPPKKPDGWADAETVLELWEHGSTLQTICESTGMSYNVVQKITADAKKAGAKRAKKVETVEE